MSQTTPKEVWVATACPMDCPDACSLEAKVDAGRVTSLRATKAQAVTAGYMCAKMGHYPDRVNGKDRILTPLVRRGPKDSVRFEPVSWDAALDEIVARLRDVIARRGAEAILPYHYDGSNGIFAHDLVDEALWRRLGVSRLARTLCAAPATEAAVSVYGKMAGVAFPDFVHARCIVVWGANPGESNIHLVPHLNEARKRGAKLVVIDPRRNQIAHHADLHLAVWPGTDLVVALWLIGEVERRGRLAQAFLEAHTRNAGLLLDEARRVTTHDAAREARVSERDLERLADLYLESSPALIRIGWGLERNRNGDGAMAAILAIPAVAGKFGVRGGGYTLSNSGAYRTRSEEMLATPAPNPAPRLLNMTELGKILDPSFAPPVEALFVYDANPMVSTPDTEGVRRGLLRDDLFVVAFDQVFTDTCRYADVVLPATTFLEQHELHRGYGAMAVQRIKPAAAPRGEARPNEVVFADLAARFGFGGPDFDVRPENLVGKFVAASRALPTDAAAKLARGEVVTPDFGGGEAPVQFDTVFPPTADRRADLHPEAWRRAGHAAFRYAPDPVTPGFPLALLSPATRKTINSVLGESVTEPLGCHLSPADAKSRGIVEGALVEVRSPTGAIRARAHLDDSLRPGVCVVPKGAWHRNCPSGANANALISSAVTPISGGATYNDTRVEVMAVGR
jgi:anaerobic selenocysteine-containing dehydrogenase